MSDCGMWKAAQDCALRARQVSASFSRRTFLAAAGCALPSSGQADTSGGSRYLVQPLIQAIRPARGEEVALEGRLGARIRANGEYLRWRYNRDGESMLSPYRNRATWQRVRDWDGEFAGKWLEAATFAAASTNPEFRTLCDRFAAELRRCQEPDGYLGTELSANRWRPSWPLWMHWQLMYALANHYLHFGVKESLRAAVAGGDWVIREFSPVSSADNRLFDARKNGVLAILDQFPQLYWITGEQRWVDFARAVTLHSPKFQEMRRNRRALLEHAYSYLTYLGAAVPIAQATGNRDEILWIEDIWEDIAAHQLFPTASISTNERLLKEPPADELGKLQETCATVEWMIFTRRLYEATGRVRYAHMIERTAYNALLGAQSTDGMKWMYYTPLRYSKDWYSGPTECCYYSGPRGIVRLPGWAYGVDGDGIRIDLYESSTATLKAAARRITVRQQTAYPAEGLIRLTVQRIEPDGLAEFALKCRIPEWAIAPRVRVAGKPFDGSVQAGEHAVLRRRWKAGEEVEISFQIGERFLSMADGSVAIARGAEVLSADLRDNPGISLEALSKPDSPRLEQMEPTAEGRRLYRCMWKGGNGPSTVVLTPFADAGNATPGVVVADAKYRTAFPGRTVQHAPAVRPR